MSCCPHCKQEIDHVEYSQVTHEHGIAEGFGTVLKYDPIDIEVKTKGHICPKCKMPLGSNVAELLKILGEDDD